MGRGDTLTGLVLGSAMSSLAFYFLSGGFEDEKEKIASLPQGPENGDTPEPQVVPLTSIDITGPPIPVRSFRRGSTSGLDVSGHSMMSVASEYPDDPPDLRAELQNLKQMSRRMISKQQLELKKTSKRALAEKQELAGQVADLGNEKTLLERQFEVVKAEKEAAETKLEEVEEELGRMQKLSSMHRKVVMDLESKCSGLEDEVLRLEDELRTTSKSLKLVTTQKEICGATCNEFMLRQTRMERDAERELEAERQRRKAENSQASIKLERLAEECANLKAEMTELMTAHGTAGLN